jgi:hypothetical protein
MAIHFAAELAEYVRDYRDQDANTLTDATCVQLVKAVEGRINRALRDHPRMRVRRSWALGSGDNVIPVPADMLSLLNVKSNGVRLDQYPAALEERATLNGGFVNYGNCIRVWPAPDETTTYTLEMTVALPSLVDESQVALNWIARYHADIYQRGMLAEAAGYLQDKEGLLLWQGLFESALENLRLQGWDEDIASAPRTHAI